MENKGNKVKHNQLNKLMDKFQQDMQNLRKMKKVKYKK